MPKYDLSCAECGHCFELTQSIHDRLPTTCPSCSSESLGQDFSAPRLCTEVMLVQGGEPTTVGAQAERNAKQMGRDLFAATERKVAGEHLVKKKETPTPWWREPGSKPLDVSTVKDVKNYILTGDKT